VKTEKKGCGEMKKFMALLLASALCLSCATCTVAGAPASEETRQKDADQYINSYLVSEPQTLDVSLRSDTYSYTIMVNTMEGLVRLEEKDGEYHMTPAGAESWESNEDGTVWTFRLRQGLWEDGQPVTAEQYVYSLQRSASPGTGSPNNFFLQPLLNYNTVSIGAAPVTELGVKALDDATLEITLSASTPSFISMINATVYYPQRRDLVESWGDKFGSEAQYYISNGPFKVESWTHNSSIVLVKNDKYWDANNVFLSKIHLSIMTDPITFYNAFESGELDYVSAGAAEWLQKFNDGTNRYTKIVLATNVYSFFNTKNALFQNVNIRKAFTLSIDRADLNEMCFGGLRIPTYGWVPASEAVGGVNYRGKAGDIIKEMSDELAAQGKTPKDLLLQGMQELGLGSDPSALKVTFSLAGTSEWYRTLGDYLIQVYKEQLGVDLEISYSEWGIFYANVQKGDYQIGFMSWGAYYNDPYDMLSLFVSSYDAIETGWSNAQYDALIKASGTEMDEAKRLQEYIDAETILLKDECVVSPLATNQTHQFTKSHVYGYATLGFTVSEFKHVYTSGRR
jgi:ABC-type oligopeptide transport system substrate-binding subunit